MRQHDGQTPDHEARPTARGEGTPQPPRGERRLAPDLATIDVFMGAGDYARALADCDQLRLEPESSAHPGLLRRAAYCLEKLGRYKDVIALLEPILAASPRASRLDAAEALEIARCRLILGKMLLEAGRMAEAEAQGQLTLVSVGAGGAGPELGFAHNLLGTIRARQGDPLEARVHFRAALEHFREHGDLTNLSLVYVNLGHLHKQDCEWARAEEHYQAAYYLRAAVGEPVDQAAILQNLALVYMKVGRYEEATEKLDASLRRSVELGDAARALRARLALAKLARESWDVGTAREYLRQCREQAPDPMPRREASLILGEEALLARLERRSSEAQAIARDFVAHGARLAPRGDLVILGRMLEGWLAADEGRWADAELCFRQARDLSRADRDRFQENLAALELLDLWVSSGRTDGAEELFLHLQDRFHRTGELPGLARLYEVRGRMARVTGGRAEEALDWCRRARELWQRMTRTRRQAMAELEIADALLDLGRVAEAAPLLHRLREQETAGDLGVPAIRERLEQVEARMRERVARGRSAGLRGDRAFAKIEEVVSSDAGPGEKIRELLVVLCEAFEADGGLVGRLGGESLEVITSLSMGRLQGRRAFSPRLLGLEETGHAAVLALPSPSGRGEGVEKISALAWPVLLYGQPHLVYVERRGDEGAGAEPYERGALDYGMVLLAQASRGLRPVISGAAGATDELVGNLHLADVITQSPSMRGILELLRRVADSELTVLLQGETGTGKKLLAEVLHRTSPRRDRPFVTVDCAALTDSLLESELFGHRKGAFTGAASDRVGLLEEGDGGTIFLDEIDKSGLSVQRRLLHMLDSGEVRPVGATSYKRLDVRVVCATSCPDLRAEVAAGRFLKDLLYRLNDISIVVPPLRERPDDIALLAECFIERFCRRLGRRLAGVAPSFHAALAAHSWPGNVRELEKAVRRAVTLVDDGGTLVAELLPGDVLESSQARVEPGRTLHEKVGHFERALILDALDRLDWNRSRTAAALGLSRRGLKNKIERYKLDRRRTRRR